MTRKIIQCVAALGLVGGSVFADPVTVEVPAQDLASALRSFAEQSGVQVVFVTALADGHATGGFSGSGEPEEILEQLLAESGLVWRLDNGHTFVIEQGELQQTADADEAPTQVTDSIIVTARRREEKLEDVPISAVVLTEEILNDKGAEEFFDVAREIPNLDVTGTGRDSLGLSIRGIRTLTRGSGGQTMSFYLDEVSISSQPAVATFDVARVEVLRGPQGTLFGEGSLGGAIRFISKPPDTEEMSGRLRLSVGTIHKGDSEWSAAGVINLPLVKDRFALRLVAHKQKNGGFVDNLEPGFEEVDLNYGEIEGTRLGTYWTPSDSLRVTLRGNFQRTLSNGGNTVTLEPAPGGGFLSRPAFELTTFSTLALPASESEFFQPSLVIGKTFASTELTSATAYYDSEGGPSEGELGFFVTEEDFTQEVRLHSTSGGRFGWLVGAFYKKETGANNTHLLGPLGEFFSDANLDLEHKAVFGTVSYRLNRTTFELGARFFEEETTEDLSLNVPDFPIINFQSFGAGDDSVFNPRFAVTHAPNNDTIIYATAAKGFRRGQVNVFNPDVFPVIPASVPAFSAPDELWSYEVGTKQSVAGGKVSLEAAAYWIDWKDIQIFDTAIFEGIFLSFVQNAGGAESKGVEFSINARPTNRLRLGLAGSFASAKLTETAANFMAGDEISVNPDYRLSPHIDYTWSLSDKAALHLRADATFQDGVLSRTGTSRDPALVTTDSYALGNLRAGLRMDRFDIYLSVKNVLDERVDYIIDRVVGTAQRNIPRTVSIDFSTSF